MNKQINTDVFTTIKPYIFMSCIETTERLMQNFELHTNLKWHSGKTPNAHKISEKWFNIENLYSFIKIDESGRFKVIHIYEDTMKSIPNYAFSIDCIIANALEQNRIIDYFEFKLSGGENEN